jgi:uncharacterized protein (DUF58 family)
MNGRGFLLLLVIFTLLLIGLGSVNGGVIALAIPLCLYLAAAVFFSPIRPEVTASRELSAERIFPGMTVNVRLSIRNEGVTAEEIHIEDILPEGMEVIEGHTTIFTSLEAGEEITLEYTVQANRGDYRFTDTDTTIREGFGLFEKKFRIPSAHRLTVRPRPTRMKPMRVHPPQTRGFAGPIPSRQGGSGNFLSREYQPGDPQRVNWKLAAHGSSELYTNIYEQERVADVGIILDAREQAYGDMATTRSSSSVQAAASLAEGIPERRQPGRPAGMGGIETAFPGLAGSAPARILQALGRARTGRNFALETLRYLPTRSFPPRSQVILVSPLIQADAPILISLSALGYAVMVICPDIIRYDAGPIQPESRGSYALRLAHAERALLLQKIRRAGVQVIDWNVELPFETLARRYSVLRMAANRLRRYRNDLKTPAVSRRDCGYRRVDYQNIAKFVSAPRWWASLASFGSSDCFTTGDGSRQHSSWFTLC